MRRIANKKGASRLTAKKIIMKRHNRLIIAIFAAFIFIGISVLNISFEAVNCSRLVFARASTVNFVPTVYNRTVYIKQGVGKSNVYYAIIDKNNKPELTLANNKMGTIENAEERAKNDKSSITINAGIFNMKTLAPIGILVKNGKLLRENDVTRKNGGRTWDVAALYMTDTGLLDSIISVNIPTETIMAKQPVWAVQGWYPIIKDGVNVSNRHSANDYQPLTCIGQDYDGNYIVVVCEGRSIYSNGMSLPDMYDFVVNKLCFNARFLYNLDGGGSSTFVYHGVRRNALTNNEDRKVSSFITFRK